MKFDNENGIFVQFQRSAGVLMVDCLFIITVHLLMFANVFFC